MKSSYVVFLCGSMFAFTTMSAQADELPMRKAGLWEAKVKLSTPGGPEIPEVSGRYCVSEEAEKKMQEQEKQDGRCSKREIKKVATGYMLDAVCTEEGGGTATFHGEYVGDFNSAYTLKQVSRAQGGSMGDMEVHATEEHKWLSATCPEDAK
ncbi:MAG: DUF3617 domain-containing protein [Methylobacillus sp.]|jgi:hypothetical protein|nr:DUF3617 domain-containing protein [Methylobacillus sp.]